MGTRIVRDSSLGSSWIVSGVGAWLPTNQINVKPGNNFLKILRIGKATCDN